MRLKFRKLSYRNGVSGIWRFRNFLRIKNRMARGLIKRFTLNVHESSIISTFSIPSTFLACWIFCPCAPIANLNNLEILNNIYLYKTIEQNFSPIFIKRKPPSLQMKFELVLFSLYCRSRTPPPFSKSGMADSH